MVASISLAAPFIVCTDTFKWNPRLSFMRPTRDQILFSRWPVGFLYRIQAIPGSNHSNSKNSVPNPADAEPPEVSDDDEEDDSNLSRFARVEVQAARERRKQQKNYERNKHVFLAALEDEKQHAALLAALEDEKQHTAVKDDDQRDEMDFFEELDDIVAMKADKEVIEMRRKELIGKGLVRITPDSLKALQQQDDDELVQPEVIVDDLDEIRELQGLTFIEKRPRKEEEEDDDAELEEGLRRRPPEVVRRRSAEGIRGPAEGIRRRPEEGIRGPAEGIRRRPEEGIRSRPAEDMRRRGLRRRPPEVVRRRSAEGIRGPAEGIRRRPEEGIRSRPAEDMRRRGLRRRPPEVVRRRSAEGIRRRPEEGIRGPAEGIRRRPEEGIRSRPAEDMRRRVLRRRPPEVVRRRSAEGIRGPAEGIRRRPEEGIKGPAEGIRRRPEEGIRSRPEEDMRRRALRRRPPEVVRRRSAEGIRGPAEVIRRRPAEDIRNRPAEGFRERPAEGVRRRPPVGVRRRVRPADGTGGPARPLRRRRRRVRRVRMPSDVPSEADLEDSEPETPLFEPEFSTTLAELLDEAKVIPVSVDGDLEVEITGIQHDSREVNPGDLFVCCTGSSTSGHIYLTEAVKRGAVAMIVSKEIPVEEAVGVKAMVMVEDVNANLPALSASFYGNPSQKLTVIGITGTNGKTTTSYLIKSMYEAMGLKTGLLGTINYYIHSNHKLEAPLTTPDALYMTKLMAKMVHNNTEACVMEASSHGLAQGRCDNVDFDIAVFMNLTRDHLDFHKTQEKYKEAKGKLFTKMTDPERHRKVVNIDDPNAPYFIAQGNPDVPLITFSMANKDADVYALEVKLSLFETQVLVSTPEGKLEISSGLLGRHNVYNMLAAVAIGIAVGAPLDEIVKGIEEVDKVPGRMELIDEEQTFAVIVDYAHTPDALARLLDSVRECGAKRIITVFGCGGDRDLGKRPMMTKIATDKSDVCILTSDNPRSEDPLDILDDMLAGVGWTMQEYLRYGKDDYYPPLPNGHRLFVHDIRFIAVRAGVAMAEAHDAVVIAGKGHEAYQIIGEEKKYFDDREECREALHHVNRLHRSGVDTREFPWRVPASY